MTIRYLGGDLVDEPTPVECNPVGYPNTDAEGRTQYDNTHFDTELEAWESILRSAQAGVSISGRMVQQSQENLRETEHQAAQDAVRFHRVHTAHRRWKRALEQDLEVEFFEQEGVDE